MYSMMDHLIEMCLVSFEPILIHCGHPVTDILFMAGSQLLCWLAQLSWTWKAEIVRPWMVCVWWLPCNSQCKCIITVSIDDWPMVVGPTHSPILCFKWKTPAPQIVSTVLWAIYDRMGRALRQWALSQTVVRCWHQLGHQVLQSHEQHYHLCHSNAYVCHSLVYE